MTLSIRPIQDQEMWDAHYALSQYAFHSSPPFEDKEKWLEFARGLKGVTCRAAFEGETPVSMAFSSAMTQNIRGTLYPASGVWGVSTHPSARRKGYCRQAVTSLLAAEREAGMVFSNLYPFRESFYERLGYVTLPSTKITKINPLNLAPLLKWDLDGEIEMKLIGEAYQTYRQYLSEMRLHRHGMAFFDFVNQASANRHPYWCALARFEGNIEGLMLYELRHREGSGMIFMAPHFYFKSSRARYLLLNWIARHMDQAQSAELDLPGDEYPETWLADLRVNTVANDHTGMSRVLDVARIGGMQVGEGRFTAQILDPVCPWNQGAWSFEAQDGKLQVSKSSQADCELSIQGLTALITGTHDAQDFQYRGWSNAGADLQAVQQNMFPRMYPFLHEVF